MDSDNRGGTGRHVPKPWGYEIIWAHTEKYAGKILHISAGASLSLQYHRIKDESIYVMSGRIRLQLGERRVVLGPGEAARITPNLVHRIEALEDSDVFEVSSAELDDVVRIDDLYGRQGTTAP